MFKVGNSVREATTKARAKGDAPGPRDKHLWTMTNIVSLVFGHKINLQQKRVLERERLCLRERVERGVCSIGLAAAT